MLLRSPETVFTCKDNMRRDEKLYFSAFVSKCKVSQGSQTFCQQGRASLFIKHISYTVVIQSALHKRK